jgi:hypothetical protein
VESPISRTTTSDIDLIISHSFRLKAEWYSIDNSIVGIVYQSEVPQTHANYP